MATKWRVWFNGQHYETFATSAKKAINNVRWRENLRYAPVWRFEAEEVGA